MYRGLRGRCPGTADAGWKLAHLQPVGLGGRGPIESYPQETIERHFRLFMSPANMFVVPSSWSGLAEVDEFLDGFLELGEAGSRDHLSAPGPIKLTSTS